MGTGTRKGLDQRSSDDRVRAEALRRAPLRADEARSLLRAHEALPDPDLRDAAALLTRATFGNAIRLFAPLYYSNLCANDCLYCGFRRGNQSAVRRVLGEEEIAQEARALLRIGHTRVLLVASEDPSPRGRRMAIDAVRAAREARCGDARVEHLGVEIAPGEAEDFRRLASAGVDSYVLFQETYDRAVFARVHPDGTKRDFDWRYRAPFRAIEGGIPSVGLGVLLGLGDPAEEIQGLIEHAVRIHDETGRWPRTVSLPRMEPAEGAPLSRDPYHPVDDATMLRLIALLRLSLPECGIILSSREGSAFRDTALAWGVTEMSAGSRTEPGGYTRPEGDATRQFELQDHRGYEEICSVLRARGYEPVPSPDPVAIDGN